MLSGDQKFVQRFFYRTVFLVLVLVLDFPAPLPSARSFTNKVYPDIRDVREQRGALFECRRERDAIVSREDRDWPAKATRKRERDLAIASAQRYAERWTSMAFPGPVRGRRVVLFRAFHISTLPHHFIETRGDAGTRNQTDIPLLRGESHRRCTSPRRLASTSGFHHGRGIFRR